MTTEDDGTRPEMLAATGRLSLGRRLRARIRSGEEVRGFLVKAPSPEIIELCALAVSDFAVIDAEHGPIGAQTCLAMVRAAESMSLPPLVRLPNHDRSTALRYLDTGVAGTLIPSVSNAGILTEAIAMLFHAPRGSRGLAGGRWSSWGLAPGLQEAVEATADDLVVVAQIEDLNALETLDELLEENRVDVFLLGPADLSTSLGIPGQLNNLLVHNACVEAVSRIVAAGRVAGMSIRSAEELRTWRARGVQYFIASAEAVIAGGFRRFFEAG